jgi:hypothetical protein
VQAAQIGRRERHPLAIDGEPVKTIRHRVGIGDGYV